MRPGSFQIALPVFHPVLFQKNFNFLSKRRLAMVLGLGLDVFGRVLDAGDPDAERTISLLPLEIPMLLQRVVNPFRRIAFEKLDRLGNRKRGRNRKQNVNVVLHSACDQELHFVLAGDAAEVGPKTFLQRGLDERSPLFRGEHAMHEATDKGMHDFEFVVVLF